MVKNKLYRLLIFLLYLVCLLPWIGRMLLNYYDYGSLLFITLIWLVFVFISFVVIGQLKRNPWMMAFIILFILISSSLLPVSLGGLEINFGTIITGLLSLFVWFIGFKLAVAQRLDGLVQIRFLLIGLALIVAHALFLPGYTQFVYSCFALYVGLATYLFLQTKGINKYISLTMISLVAIIAFGFAGIKNGILFLIWVIYRYVIVNILLLMLAPLSFLVGGIDGEGEQRSRERESEGSQEEEPVRDPFEALEPSDEPFSLPLFEIIKWLFIAAVFLLVIYFLFKMIKKFKMRETFDDDSDDVEKEFIPASISFNSNFIQRGKSLFHSFKEAVLPDTREGKVRKLYRQTLNRMAGKEYPVSKQTTPKEAKGWLATKQTEMFDLYNRIRYGEKTITSEELKEADDSYQEIKKEVNQKEKK